MKARPILFSTPMIRALLSGEKTQTRRRMKPQPRKDRYNLWSWDCGGTTFGWKEDWEPISPQMKCHYGSVGDMLWVRESFCFLSGGLYFKANHIEPHSVSSKWKPSIHMPKNFSRLTLEITGVRVQRLNKISEQDAQAEGCKGSAVVNTAGDDYSGLYPSEEYMLLWDDINGAGSWFNNPWVWALKFKVHKKNIVDFLAERVT
jgi:hypothetical protein